MRFSGEFFTSSVGIVKRHCSRKIDICLNVVIGLVDHEDLGLCACLHLNGLFALWAACVLDRSASVHGIRGAQARIVLHGRHGIDVAAALRRLCRCARLLRRTRLL